MKWYHWLGLGVVGWLVWKTMSKDSAIKATPLVTSVASSTAIAISPEKLAQIVRKKEQKKALEKYRLELRMKTGPDPVVHLPLIKDGVIISVQ